MAGEEGDGLEVILIVETLRFLLYNELGTAIAEGDLKKKQNFPAISLVQVLKSIQERYFFQQFSFPIISLLHAPPINSRSTLPTTSTAC